MLVSEMMSKPVVTVSMKDTATEAARLLARHNIGLLPVTSEEGRLRGVISDRDIVTRCIAPELDPIDTYVSEIMSKSVLCVSPEDDIREAARKMSVNRVRRLPVVKSDHLVGIISLGDLAEHPAYDMEAGHALSEICSNLRRM